MATDPKTSPSSQIVSRNNARTRWFHAGVYVLVLVLLFTGWWLTLGGEGEPSVLANLFGVPDTDIHVVTGWLFAGLAALGVIVGWRAARTLLVDSVRFRRTDLAWFARWPAALFTGRFRRHNGHFDPGQRIMNLILIVLLLALLISGLGLLAVPGGPLFVLYNRIHIWSTYLLTPAVLGHIIVAAGILPGYRGAWRAMHLGGRLQTHVAERLWPAWLERQRQPGSVRARPPHS